MAVFYLDSSALLKRYRSEPGTDVVDDVYDNRRDVHILLTSHLTCVEVESVAARAAHAGVLNELQYRTLLGAFGRDLSNGLRLVPVTAERLNEAARAVRDVPLRSLDAIHFAVIKRLSMVWSHAPFVFVGSDRELLSACGRFRINVLNPESADALQRANHFRTLKSGG